MGRGLGRDRVHRALGAAANEIQHLDGGPGKDPFGGRQAGRAPAFVDLAPCRDDARQRRARGLWHGVGCPAGHTAFAQGADDRGQGMGHFRAGIAQEPAEIARMPPASAVADRQAQRDRPASAQEHDGLILGQPWPVRGHHEIGLEVVFQPRADRVEPGRSHFLAHLHQHVAVEAKRAARFQHQPQRCQVDQKLPLVIGHAAPVKPPLAFG